MQSNNTEKATSYQETTTEQIYR